MKLIKPELSTLEVHSIAIELQVLAGGKIDQIYEVDDEYFFQFHVPSVGKKLLRILSGKLAYFTAHKILMDTPGNFCMQLRKHLSGAGVLSLEQVESQRIIKLTLKRADERFVLYFELFSKGNIILCNDKQEIIALLERQSWESREVKPHEKYVLPPLEFNLFEIDRKQFDKKLKADKDKLVTLLAPELSIGGFYAEELCRRAKLDKDMVPGTLRASDKTLLWTELQKLLKETARPLGFVYEGVISPVKLTDMAIAQEFETFSLALDVFLSTSKAAQEKARLEDRYKQKIKEYERILEDQGKRLAGIDGRVAEYAAVGDLMYQKYTELKKLLAFAEHVRATSGWGEVEKELKILKYVKMIDMKEKKVTIEI